MPVGQIKEQSGWRGLARVNNVQLVAWLKVTPYHVVKASIIATCCCWGQCLCRGGCWCLCNQHQTQEEEETNEIVRLMGWWRVHGVHGVV